MTPPAQCAVNFAPCKVVTGTAEVNLADSLFPNLGNIIGNAVLSLERNNPDFNVAESTIYYLRVFGYLRVFEMQSSQWFVDGSIFS